jgi:hypothetical protein
LVHMKGTMVLLLPMCLSTRLPNFVWTDLSITMKVVYERHDSGIVGKDFPQLFDYSSVMLHIV